MPHITRFTNGVKALIDIFAGAETSEVRDKIAAWFAVFAAYLVTAQIGTFLYRDLGTSPALIWPPVGIALVAVWYQGYWIWTAIAPAALLNGFLNDAPWLITLGSALGNTIQPLVGGYILRRFQFNPLMNSLRDVFLIISVATCATLIVPMINSAFAHLYNVLFDVSRATPQWNATWIGGALSALVLTPFLARWIGRDMTRRTPLQRAEVLLSICTVVIISAFVFVYPISQFLSTTMLLALLGSLFWIALRVGPRIMSLAIVLMTGISIYGAIYGIHLPSSNPITLGQRLISTQIFDLLMAFFFFILVSVEEQRKNALKSLNHDARSLGAALQKIKSEDKAKNEFIATLAHELRNPLAPILSGLELLKISEKDPDKREIIESAERQSHVMRRLLDELLDVARVTQHKYMLQKADISLQSVVEQSIQTVRHFLDERRHVFTMTVPKADIWLNADATRLTQVFTNILFNAGKYTPPGGEISLSVELENDLAVVRIRDSGIGIDSGMLEGIFEAFVQIQHKAPHGTGLGLGLSITKRLVELHGGKIEAISEGENQGSEFIVRLPVIESITTAKNSLVAPKMITPMRMLIVDDNRDAAESLSKLLTLRGHDVDIAQNGRDAIEAMARKPRAVILDIGLPDIDGYEVARTMRAHDAQVTIIGLSGYGTPDVKQRAKEAQFDEHITKPASLSDIEAALTQHLR